MGLQIVPLLHAHHPGAKLCKFMCSKFAHLGRVSMQACNTDNDTDKCFISSGQQVRLSACIFSISEPEKLPLRSSVTSSARPTSALIKTCQPNVLGHPTCIEQQSCSIAGIIYVEHRCCIQHTSACRCSPQNPCVMLPLTVAMSFTTSCIYVAPARSCGCAQTMSHCVV